MNRYLYKRKKFLSTNEQILYHVLVEYLHDFYIFPQIHLGSFVTPRVRKHAKSGWKFWRYARTSADRRSVDFLICRHEDLNPLFVIELDGIEHESPNHIVTDQELDRILDEADLPIIRIKNSDINDSSLIKTKIDTVLNYLDR